MPEPLLDELARAPRTAPAGAGDALAWTLADHLACVLGAGSLEDRVAAFEDDGVVGTASALALRASWLDRDDVDWAVLTHPGSVVWSVTLAVASRSDADGPALGRAAYLGYRATATMAHRLGRAHRARWHVTATAGGFGAAAAAGALLGLAPEEQANAFAHVAAGTGGIGQAALERRGAAAFNRAAAAALGIQAVRAASFGAVPVESPLDGERGLLALTAGEPANGPQEAVVVDGLDRVAPRVYPVSGFGQGAVLAAARLSARTEGVPHRLVVEVAEPAVRLMDGSAGGAWWSLPEAVAAAWTTGDPSALTASPASRGLVDRVQVVAGDLPVGAARVRAVTDAGTTEAAEAAPGAGPELTRKWSAMLAAAGRSEDVAVLAEAILRDGLTEEHLELLTVPRRTRATERQR